MVTGGWGDGGCDTHVIDACRFTTAIGMMTGFTSSKNVQLSRGCLELPTVVLVMLIVTSTCTYDRATTHMRAAAQHRQLLTLHAKSIVAPVYGSTLRYTSSRS